MGGGEIVEPVVRLRRAERGLESLRPGARLQRAEPLEGEPPLALARERGAGPEERLPDVRRARVPVGERREGGGRPRVVVRAGGGGADREELLVVLARELGLQRARLRRVGREREAPVAGRGRAASGGAGEEDRGGGEEGAAHPGEPTPRGASGAPSVCAGRRTRTGRRPATSRARAHRDRRRSWPSCPRATPSRARRCSPLRAGTPPRAAAPAPRSRARAGDPCARRGPRSPGS